MLAPRRSSTAAARPRRGPNRFIEGPETSSDGDDASTACRPRWSDVHTDWRLLLGLVALLLVLRGPLRFQLLDVREVLLHVRQNFFLLDNTGLRGVLGSWRGTGGLCEVVS